MGVEVASTRKCQGGGRGGPKWVLLFCPEIVGWLVSITNLLSLDGVYFILIHDAAALKPQYSGGGR